MVGIINEIKLLESKYNSDKSEFVALYGRRRVGKTYLIRSVFQNRFVFQLTGMANSTLQEQLTNFSINFQEQHSKIQFEKPLNWMNAFQNIIPPLKPIVHNNPI